LAGDLASPTPSNPTCTSAASPTPEPGWSSSWMKVARCESAGSGRRCEAGPGKAGQAKGRSASAFQLPIASRSEPCAIPPNLGPHSAAVFDPPTTPGKAFRESRPVTRTGPRTVDACGPYPKRGTRDPEMDASGVTFRDDLGRSTHGVLKHRRWLFRPDHQVSSALPQSRRRSSARWEQSRKTPVPRMTPTGRTAERGRESGPERSDRRRMKNRT
jgi:hypothetical protein